MLDILLYRKLFLFGDRNLIKLSVIDTNKKLRKKEKKGVF
jgi:hypothetical protein